MLTVIVPASSANVGSGFDSFGVALSLYNHYQVLDLLPPHTYDIEVIRGGYSKFWHTSRGIEAKVLQCHTLI